MSREKQTTLQKSENVGAILKLRLAVGLLGEKAHGNWWPSGWFTSNAAAFLTPIYGKRADVARYHGLVEAARRVHDSHIGVGKAFHLFRLPESLERRLHDSVLKEGALQAARTIEDRTSAQALLEELEADVGMNTGPIRIGTARDLEGIRWAGSVAGNYLKAFKGGHQSFPYFAGD